MANRSGKTLHKKPAGIRYPRRVARDKADKGGVFVPGGQGSPGNKAGDAKAVAAGGGGARETRAGGLGPRPLRRKE